MIKIGDFFAGIGGFHQATKNITNVKCSISCEIDINARKTYLANHETQKFVENIRDINYVEDLDILFAGFPCQSFSVAGYRKGFDDSRGAIVFHLIDIINKNTPKIIFLENVKNLLSHDKGQTFDKIISLLKWNYNVSYKIFNSCDFCIPQNRERVYIVGFREDVKNDFIFPGVFNKRQYNIYSFLSKKKVDNIYYYNDKPLWGKIKKYPFKKGVIYQWRRRYIRENKSGLFPTLTANMGTGGHNVPIIKDDFGIRKITPNECLTIQGFDKSFKFAEIPNGQKYKQVGNSVSVPVVERILEQIIRYL